ncbi:hypothetical protein BLI708_00435 [Bifidobacterium imperatoris]|uniref:Bacterial Ig-like domain, group 2 n=1 Tax=Bifidobacterium imperatoris TaxID=2020965 RepID=A0A2N5IP79_9BIFI|nr:hypothetical protein [Bifidobacterium imperatoris]PLS23760.1 bacterial Ig-like domain, group 2 [Bifidobacterium imperatoris]QSY57795.1 hypothetical protein BLI708_00140 [Bifidobacterium imperatoris]QSY57844.1 hypothetical protein BLI708_00435 [Bifidobacterium imperatoris]
MPVYVNGVEIGQPYLNGRLMNALYNGRKVWATPADTVTGVEILASDGKPAPTTLPINGSVELAARATYADGHKSELLTMEHVFWKSLDESVATVSGNTVTWVHGGTAMITAKIGGFTSAALSLAAGYEPESVSVLDDAGKPVESIALRVGESVNLRVRILPEAAAQEFTASIKDTAIASTGAAKPAGITVTPESLTLRVGETASLNVSILPDYAPQEYEATIKNIEIATASKEE